MSTDHNEAMRLSKPEAIAQFAQQAANEGPMVHTVPWQQLSGGLLMCSNAIRDLLAERDQLRAEVERLRADAERLDWLESEAEGFGGIAAGPFATDFGKHTHNAMAAGAKNCTAAIEQLRGK